MVAGSHLEICVCENHRVVLRNFQNTFFSGLGKIRIREKEIWLEADFLKRFFKHCFIATQLIERLL